VPAQIGNYGAPGIAEDSITYLTTFPGCCYNGQTNFHALKEENTVFFAAFFGKRGYDS
jgi:hypothetical protein